MGSRYIKIIKMKHDKLYKVRVLVHHDIDSKFVDFYFPFIIEIKYVKWIKCGILQLKR